MLKYWFLSLIGRKTLWEKEKMLVTSIFSFFPTMFSKTLCFKVVKSRDCVVKNYSACKMKNKCHVGWKTLWEKQKLLVTCNFSFSHNVFHSYVSLVHQNVALCGNGLRFKWLLKAYRKVGNKDYFIKPSLPVCYKHVSTGGNRA